MDSQKLIVNELLAFMQNALNEKDLDCYSIVNTCKVNFNPEEIYRAKELFFQSLGKAEPTNIRECSEQNLMDIIDLFEKTAVNNVPDFVAKQLNKLPLVLLERPSIQSMLMEIRFLKASLVELQSKLVAANDTVNELCKQVYAMHKAERKQCWSQVASIKEPTLEVKSTSIDSKSGDVPRPAPRTSITSEATSRADTSISSPCADTAEKIESLPTKTDCLDLSKLGLKVDKDGYIKVRTKRDTTN